MFRIFTFVAIFIFSTGMAQSSWPSISWNTADNLTGIMNAEGITDLSGLHWNPISQRLYCVQGDGRLRVLQLNNTTMGFTQIANKALADGPEGITQVNFSANEFYTIDENNYEIRKFTHNATFGALTETKHWDLLASPSPMEDTGNTGPEGIIFIPDASLSAIGFVSQMTGNPYTSVKGMGGLMFVAHQDEGYIWVFDVNPNVTNDFAYVGKYKTSREESTDLSFDRTTGLLYILHNIESNYLEVTNLSSAMVSGERKLVTQHEYFIANPTGANINVEGFAMMPKCPDTGAISAWLARDVESNEGDAVLQDALRWFNPFTADGTCAPLSSGHVSIENDLTIYPNPGNSQVTVSFGNDVRNGSIKVINILGQVVLQKPLGGNEFVFDVTSFQSGPYLIEIRQEQNVSVLKWIKQ
jgi:hypothetical protein